MISRTGEPDWSLVRPDFEIHDHELPDSPAHRGREGWLRWVADWEEAFADHDMEAIDQTELDRNRILTVHRLRARGRASGLELDRIDAQLWSFSGNQLARMDYFPNYEARDRSWSPPGNGRRSAV